MSTSWYAIAFPASSNVHANIVLVSTRATREPHLLAEPLPILGQTVQGSDKHTHGRPAWHLPPKPAPVKLVDTMPSALRPSGLNGPAHHNPTQPKYVRSKAHCMLEINEQWRGSSTNPDGCNGLSDEETIRERELGCYLFNP